ncbi:MAG: DUF169 domain-containing protein [Bacteroidales bacterium]|nr:DUF169 domain-containing protein [Bacteroidales bacterium]
MTPNPSYLLEKTGIKLSIIAFYDAPDSKPFEPVIKPNKKGHACMYSFYKRWQKGKTVALTKTNYGCGGASHHIFNQPTRPHEDFIKFLTDDEGLKANRELMDMWIKDSNEYQPRNEYILYGPLKEDLYEYAKTITFFVNPDQLSMLMIGAQYNTKPGDPEPVIAPFGSGCMLSVSLFKDLNVPQAIIGATDMAMRQFLPPDILAFTVTKPMYENLCKLDKNSFLEKGFIKQLRKVRK